MRELTPTAKTNRCAKWLKITRAGAGFKRGTFNNDETIGFAHKWFAWPNTLFGELVIKMHKYYLELL